MSEASESKLRRLVATIHASGPPTNVSCPVANSAATGGSCTRAGDARRRQAAEPRRQPRAGTRQSAVTQEAVIHFSATTLCGRMARRGPSRPVVARRATVSARPSFPFAIERPELCGRRHAVRLERFAHRKAEAGWLSTPSSTSTSLIFDDGCHPLPHL